MSTWEIPLVAVSAFAAITCVILIINAFREGVHR